MLQSGIKINELRRVTSKDLLEHDLLIVSQSRLERDEDGETILNELVAIELKELKKYLRRVNPPVTNTED